MSNLVVVPHPSPGGVSYPNSPQSVSAGTGGSMRAAVLVAVALILVAGGALAVWSRRAPAAKAGSESAAVQQQVQQAEHQAPEAQKGIAQTSQFEARVSALEAKFDRVLSVAEGAQRSVVEAAQSVAKAAEQLASASERMQVLVADLKEVREAARVAHKTTDGSSERSKPSEAEAASVPAKSESPDPPAPRAVSYYYVEVPRYVTYYVPAVPAYYSSRRWSLFGCR